jgi:hypothetical protein
MAKTRTSPLFGPRAKEQAAGMRPMPTEVVEKVDKRDWPFLPKWPRKDLRPARARVQRPVKLHWPSRGCAIEVKFAPVTAIGASPDGLELRVLPPFCPHPACLGRAERAWAGRPIGNTAAATMLDDEPGDDRSGQVHEFVSACFDFGATYEETGGAV